MIWMWFSTIVIPLGGEINAEMERQTANDTSGTTKPFRRRGTTVADELGWAHS
jgi:membrane protein